MLIKVNNCKKKPYLKNYRYIFEVAPTNLENFPSLFVKIRQKLRYCHDNRAADTQG